MTKVEITIQERNGEPVVTWVEQKGDLLPESVWDELNVAVRSVINNLTD
jgi:hypothetical protein